MKLQFDPNQGFQLDAVAAVTDLFDGQPQGPPEYSVINLGSAEGLFAGQDRTELGVGNRLLLAEDKLREGRDNPNVFQICTLNETKSAVKKRQEIGRGLRLPVDQNGVRVFDESVNRLYVMANESYED
jgi:restriction endonuclease